MFFHWKYLDERLRQTAPGRAGNVSGFYVGIARAEDAPRIIREIDGMFDNSLAETKTETEREFRMRFVSMAGTIVTAIRVISVVVVAVILLVLANTMAMTARERVTEYAVLKTLGFRPKHLVALILGESSLIAVAGGALGLLITFPMVHAFARFLTQSLGNFFPVFEMQETTVLLAVLASLAVGVLAALFPSLQAVRMKIADGLLYIG
ncbi:MAG: ABC transporter permease [Calditrichaeota bacterium]|nr:MAG: ABC transporter permease [Calditrichota bacterium]